MNCIEAVAFMQGGGMVIYTAANGEEMILKFTDTIITARYKNDCAWRKLATLDLDANYEEYIKPKVLTGWERTEDINDTFYYIGTEFVAAHPNNTLNFYDSAYNKANAFSTKEKAEEINFKQTLFRKLQRFSDENGGSEIDWNNSNTRKYFIYFDNSSKKIMATSEIVVEIQGVVFFKDLVTANKAIKIFHDDLIKYFTM